MKQHLVWVKFRVDADNINEAILLVESSLSNHKYFNTVLSSLSKEWSEPIKEYKKYKNSIAK